MRYKIEMKHSGRDTAACVKVWNLISGSARDASCDTKIFVPHPMRVSVLPSRMAKSMGMSVCCTGKRHRTHHVTTDRVKVPMIVDSFMNPEREQTRGRRRASVGRSERGC